MKRHWPVLNRLVDRARQQGSLREDLAGTDIVFVQLALAGIMNATREVNPELYRRYLAIFLDGIRAEAAGPGPLPVTEPTAEHTQQILSPSRPASSVTAADGHRVSVMGRSRAAACTACFLLVGGGGAHAHVQFEAALHRRG